METETKPRRMAGLTIACDHCPRTACYRHETPAAFGANVHWSCPDHAPVSA